jgi:hypothetical protein
MSGGIKMADTYFVKCEQCNEVKESKEVPFIKVYQRNSNEPSTGSFNIGKDICWTCLKKIGVNKK